MGISTVMAGLLRLSQVRAAIAIVIFLAIILKKLVSPQR